MKKDVVLALIIGLSIGAAIAIAAVRLPLLLEQNDGKAKVSQNKEISPTIIITSGKEFVVTSPQDQAIIETKETAISGKAAPNSPIIIETPDDSVTLESGNDGSFTTRIGLKEGGNPVYVSAIGVNGDAETKFLTLFHTNENL